MDVYPVKFDPIFKPKIWGGRRLESLLNKTLPPHAPVGESWEIADLEDDQSVVTAGPAKGKTLTALVDAWGEALLGRAELFEGRFPLLIKFLDAHESLSVQVHPDAAMAKRLGGRVRIKNEAWYIVDALDDGFIYRGLKPGTDANQLRTAISDGCVERLMNRIAVRKGHCYYLPSGTLHALGAGVVVAEVQTPSDITYRVYDFGRVDVATGKPRDLHIDEALQCISFDAGPIPGEHHQHVASMWTSVTSLVRSESFVLERVRMVAGVEQPLPYHEMVIWMVLEGSGTLRCAGLQEQVYFAAGDTVLIPAAIRDGVVQVNESTLWLEVTLPIQSDLAGFERPARQRMATAPSSPFVALNVPGASATTPRDGTS